MLDDPNSQVEIILWEDLVLFFYTGLRLMKVSERSVWRGFTRDQSPIHFDSISSSKVEKGLDFCRPVCNEHKLINALAGLRGNL